MRRVSQLSSQYLTLSNLTKVMHLVYVLLSSSFDDGGEKDWNVKHCRCLTCLLWAIYLVFHTGFKEWEVRTWIIQWTVNKMEWWFVIIFFKCVLIKSKFHLIIQYFFPDSKQGGFGFDYFKHQGHFSYVIRGTWKKYFSKHRRVIFLEITEYRKVITSLNPITIMSYLHCKYLYLKIIDCPAKKMTSQAAF